jgi:sugar/nucleoside kinase (ribokinase family)
MATNESLEDDDHPPLGSARRSVDDGGPRAAVVVVLGEINPDIVVTGVPPLSFWQREDVTGPTSMTVGSSVAILASGLVRLGTATGIVGVVGDDPFGDFMLRSLQERGVDVSLVRTIRGGRTGSSVILVRRDADDRQILTDPGVMGELRASDLPLSRLDGARHLHIGSWFLHSGAVEALPNLLAGARALGLSTSLDPNDDPAQQWDSHLERALPHVETLFCNEAEAFGIAAAGGWNGRGSSHRAARYLLGKIAFGGTVVLKLGPRGAFAHTADGTLHVAAPPADVSDSVGAGDNLAAGFLHSRLQGAELDEALRLAVATGTLSTRRSGGVAAQATPEEAHEIARQLTCSIHTTADEPVPVSSSHDRRNPQ